MAGRDIVRRIDITERRLRALDLKRDDPEITWAAVASEAGYSSGADACKDISRVRDRSNRELGEIVAEMRAAEDAKLDHLEAVALEVLNGSEDDSRVLPAGRDAGSDLRVAPEVVGSRFSGSYSGRCRGERYLRSPRGGFREAHVIDGGLLGVYSSSSKPRR